MFVGLSCFLGSEYQSVSLSLAGKPTQNRSHGLFDMPTFGIEHTVGVSGIMAGMFEMSNFKQTRPNK